MNAPAHQEIDLQEFISRRSRYVHPRSVMAHLSVNGRVSLFRRFRDTRILRQFQPGATIFLQNLERPRVHLVVEGFVKLTGRTSRGPAIVDIRGADELIGEIDALTYSRASIAATAMTRVVSYQMSPDEFRSMVEQSPGIHAAVTAALALRVRSTHYQQGHKLEVKHRLAQRLLDLALAMHPTGPIASFIIPVTQREMAVSIGASENRIHEQLTEWKREGVVLRERSRSSVRVLNAAALVRVLESELAVPDDYLRFTAPTSASVNRSPVG